MYRLFYRDLVKRRAASFQGSMTSLIGAIGQIRKGSQMKVNIYERVVVALVIGGMLLIGASIPANAQENQDKKEAKQQRTGEQQQSAEEKAAQKQANKAQRQQQHQADQKQIDAQKQQVACQQLERQQELVVQQQQRQTQYRQQMEEQQRLGQQRTAQLQQQRRTSQYRYQQQYALRLQQLRIQEARRCNTSYYYAAPTYRYSRGGSYYETNQYGANSLRQAINYGYEQGFRSGQGDRQDRWQSGYQDSYAYQDANYGYSGYYVDQNDYNYYFREGFRRGYEDGYDSRSQYGRYSSGKYSILAAVLTGILNLQSLR